MSLLMLLTLLLVVLGPFLIVGGFLAVAAPQCPELVRRPRQTRAIPRAAWA